MLSEAMRSLGYRVTPPYDPEDCAAWEVHCPGGVTILLAKDEAEAWEKADTHWRGEQIAKALSCIVKVESPTIPRPPMIDPNELERLSKAATQGEWKISAYYTGTGPDEKCHGLVVVEDFPIGIIDEEGATAESLSPNLEFVTTLVNAYRAGQLVPVQQPSGDVVEAVARAIMVVNGACLVKDWAIERRDNPHVALAWDQATAAITALDAVRVKQ